MKKTLAFTALLSSVPLWASSTQPVLRYIARQTRLELMSQQEITTRIWETIDTDGDLSAYTWEELGLFFFHARRAGQVMLYSPNPRRNRGSPKSPKLATPGLRRQFEDKEGHVLYLEDLYKR